MLRKKLETRRRQILDLLLEGKTEEQIANKLNVSIQTISSDIQELNERYKKQVIDNPDYLNRHLEHIFKKIDELDSIKSKLYDLNDDYDLIKSKLEELQLNNQENSGFKTALKIESLLTRIKERVNILKEIVNIVEKQSKLENILTPDINFIQNNYITIDKVNILVDKMLTLVDLFVLEDKKVEALEFLKKFSLELDKE